MYKLEIGASVNTKYLYTDRTKKHENPSDEKKRFRDILIPYDIYSNHETEFAKEFLFKNESVREMRKFIQQSYMEAFTGIGVYDDRNIDAKRALLKFVNILIDHVVTADYENYNHDLWFSAENLFIFSYKVSKVIFEDSSEFGLDKNCVVISPQSLGKVEETKYFTFEIQTLLEK